MEINSTDFHDFVIKDGMLIGEFEQMYKKSKDVPWNQDKQENWLDVRLAIELLSDYGPFDFICDFGCGLGYFLDILKREVGRRECEALGCDLSKECCKKARHIFPGIKFLRLDLMKNGQPAIIDKDSVRGKRLFTLRGVLWYVFPQIGNVVENIAANIGGG